MLAQQARDFNGSFSYDANGNLLSGADISITWTSFDMPTLIRKGSASSTFVYGPEHQRVKHTHADGSVTLYAGDQEVVKDSAGNVRLKTYWPGGAGVEIDRPNQPTALYWTHRDRLGSPIAQSDASGVLAEKLAYDAWGKRRTTDGAATPDTLDGATDNKGFTGHEMLDELDLVHMNGRVYNPRTGQFISADPLIQDPVDGQSYNRYSYVLNNPTNLSDPTGFAPETERTDPVKDKEACDAECKKFRDKAKERLRCETSADPTGCRSHAAKLGAQMQWNAANREAQIRSEIRDINRAHMELVAAASGEALSTEQWGAQAAAYQGLIDRKLAAYQELGEAPKETFYPLLNAHVQASIFAGAPDDRYAPLMAAIAISSGMIVGAPMNGPGTGGAAKGALPAVGGGAKLENLSPQEILRIQKAANRTGTQITVVGSRANGTSHGLSDWDYVVPEGTAKRTIHSLSSSLPEGHRGLGERRNQDFFRSTVDPNRPHITFTPQ